VCVVFVCAWYESVVRVSACAWRANVRACGRVCLCVFVCMRMSVHVRMRVCMHREYVRVTSARVYVCVYVCACQSCVYVRVLAL